jgi:hypothetical protein
LGAEEVGRGLASPDLFDDLVGVRVDDREGVVARIGGDHVMAVG